MKETHRAQARARITDLVSRLKGMPSTDGLESLVEEAEALGRAVDAFHMEAIRFRMFNVDRQLHRLPGGAPEGVERLLAEVRALLESAGLHSR